VIGPLVKEVMKIDLDSKGVAVVPIFGKHFSPYAKLFGPDGITKKCAILPMAIKRTMNRKTG